MPRLPTAERRRQIVLAALTLLANTPVEGLTTRALAAAVGVSQPALFRHFRSREAIVQALLDHVRSELASAAAELVVGEGLERAESLAEILGEQVARSPGILRLLIHDAGGQPGTAGQEVAALVSTQRALVAELVRQGQASSDVPERTDPDAAGAALIALVQGTLLQWQLEGRPPGAAVRTRRAARLWTAGVRAGEPARERSQPLAPPPPVPELTPLLALDARPILAQGQDPLSRILACLDQLAPTGLLRLTAPFEPHPLVALLQGRGFTVQVSSPEPRRFEVDVLAPAAPALLDLRDLPAPEPLEQVLRAVADLPPDGVLLARLPRIPRLLLPRLDERGLDQVLLEEADGSTVLWVRRPA